MLTDAEPIRILAEDHFGGSWALIAAIVCSVLPVLYVAGVLVTWALRARSGEAYEARSFRIVLGFVLVLATAFLLAIAPYWGRRVYGETLIGEVTDSERLSRRSGSYAMRYTITLPDGRKLRESVEPEQVELMTTGRSVYVRAIRGVRGFERLGDEATLGELGVTLSLVVWGFLVVVGLSRPSSSHTSSPTADRS